MAVRTINFFFFWPIPTSIIFIKEIMIVIKLIRHLKVIDTIDTIERLRTKLKYDVNDRNQIHSLP